tara:strand:- start:690 stop:1007 length:318 start_codon:yes stop_codon:yes gene_type:complete
MEFKQTNRRANNLKTSITSYGEYSNSNYGAHCMRVNLENGDSLYYSYRTLIAFTYDCNLYVSENCFSSTTGRHLNFIDSDKSKRLKREEFESLFDKYHNQIREVA